MLDDECSVDLLELAALKEGLRLAIPAREFLERGHTVRLSDSRAMEYSGWHRLTARTGY